jgi:CheY-like chemotaxis protein
MDSPLLVMVNTGGELMRLFRKTRIADVAKPIPLDEIRRRAKIIVIDDDPNSFPCDILRKEGYTIECWEKVESLSRLERGDFDIIILDIGGVASHYSPQDGLGVLEHLKNYNPSQIVVAFSGQTFDLGKTRFWKMADDSLSKPVDVIKCKEVIDHLLQEKFTIEHYWQGLIVLLRSEGMTEEEIEKLEKRVAGAIKKGNKNELTSILKSITEKGEIAVRLAGVAAKIIALCGA